LWLDDITFQDDGETETSQSNRRDLPVTNIVCDIVPNHYYCDHSAFYCCRQGSVAIPCDGQTTSAARITTRSGTITSRSPTGLLLSIVAHAGRKVSGWPIAAWRPSQSCNTFPLPDLEVFVTCFRACIAPNYSTSLRIWPDTAPERSRIEEAIVPCPTVLRGVRVRSVT
jgi:hypothetical protein